jgi:ABC-type transport system involved in cytochrome c biogenesis permease subunit
VAGQPFWASKLAFLRSGPLSVLFFVAGTVVWVIFILQDNVLVGLRRTAWVPVENGLCSLAKISLLPLLAFTAQWAIYPTRGECRESQEVGLI